MMTPMEILAAIRTAQTLFDLALKDFQTRESLGGLSEEMKQKILDAAEISDHQVDDLVEEARERLENGSQHD